MEMLDKENTAQSEEMDSASVEDQLKKIAQSLAHIESLLQRMPEMVATATMLEKERADFGKTMGRMYSDMVILCPIENR